MDSSADPDSLLILLVIVGCIGMVAWIKSASYVTIERRGVHIYDGNGGSTHPTGTYDDDHLYVTDPKKTKRKRVVIIQTDDDTPFDSLDPFIIGSTNHRSSSDTSHRSDDDDFWSSSSSGGSSFGGGSFGGGGSSGSW